MDALTIGASAVSGSLALSTYAQSALEDKVQQLVNAWLAASDLPGGNTIHIATSLAVEAVFTADAPLAGLKNKANKAISGTTSAFTMSPEVANYMNEVLSVVQPPNIEGIPIFSTKERQSGKNDVSQAALIVQQDTASTTYVCDNAVPHPREWTLTGYLSTVLPTDNYFVIKPSILMQRNYLEACRMSRRPVWYKTYDNRFYRALITSIETEYNPNEMNGLSISISMVEYVPFKVNTLRGAIANAIASAALAL